MVSAENLTIVFTDIKGFTQRVSAGSREDLSHLRSVHENLLIPIFDHFEGRIIKTIGDAFLVTFTSPTDAIMCGMAIQETLRQYNFLHGKTEPLDLRVAINSGEVDVTDNDIFGEPVNIAARLEGIAEPGEVFFTEAVYLSMNRSEVPSAEIGERTFKGIPYPIRVYKAIHEPNSDFAQWLARGIVIADGATVINGLHHRTRKGANPSKYFIILLVAALLIGGALYLGLRGPSLQTRIKMAKARVVDIEKTQDSAAALAWLKKELAAREDLAPLRNMISILDARATMDKALGKTLTDPQRSKIISTLLTRYPTDPVVPLVAAWHTRDKLIPFFPLQLFKAALDRKAEKDEKILSFCLKLMDKYAPGNIELAHLIAHSYFPKKAHSYAVKVMEKDKSGNHRRYANAWKILKSTADPRLKDTYYINLLKLANGLPGGSKDTDKVLQTYLAVTDSHKREQLLSLARKREKIRSGSTRAMKRVLQALEDAWGKK